MLEDTITVKAEAVDTALDETKLEEIPVSLNENEAHDLNGVQQSPRKPLTKSASSSPLNTSSVVHTPKMESEEHEETLGGDITISLEVGKAPKLSRKSLQKIVAQPPRLFNHVPDSTTEAVTEFQVIRDCIYGSKYMGSSEHDALGCDCSEEWSDGKNNACGEDSDCINRATKMECIDEECNCGSACQNQRFQRKQWANVSVIKTEKKGYGLRTDSDLQPNEFIFEYVGEVINEPTFRRRTIQYDEDGIKHFYFMSLTRSEFVDATRKGNLGRFCNHSCNPNCYVDKWVVGDKLRMGIFAERYIKAGEELVFNYNVDRYGADPQPCYCDEPNCTGFIGGKTQTERATKLSHTTIEALGIDDGDGWDTAVAKKPRKKKVGEDDEEYVNNVQPKGLDEDGVTKVMATLMQCKEKWIAVKLLSRIQRCDDDRVRNRVARMHGYQILRTTLTTWIEDNNVILQVLDILYKFPRLTKNKIVDSKIEAAIEPLKASEHEGVVFEAKRLLDEWSKLEVAYRIPRKKFDPSLQQSNHFDRRGGDREEETPKTPASGPLVAPTGPRNSVPQRFAPTKAIGPPRQTPVRRAPLPSGWYATLDPDGHTYYYTKSGKTTWQRPTVPEAEPPPPPKAPPRAVTNQKALQDIIDSLTKEPAGQPRASSTPQPTEVTPREKKAEKWRSLTQEKQMKLYENTLFPHIKYVMDKFRHKLPKDDLKKFAKEIGKKLVASDFKNKRVEDPTKITSKHEKKVKKYVRDYFDKAVAKKAEHDKKRAERKAKVAVDVNDANGKISGQAQSTLMDIDLEVKAEDLDPIEMSDDEDEVDGANMASGQATPTSATPSEDNLKRKREEETAPSSTQVKRLKDEHSETEQSPPPPPPPPPAEAFHTDVDADVDMDTRTSEERDLAAQEEALMRENEEALMLENEEAMRDAEALKEDPSAPIPGSIDDVDERVNGLETADGDSPDSDTPRDETNHALKMELTEAEGPSGLDDTMGALSREREQVLSH